jgi:plasmid stabilization system protein ParE
LTKPLFLGLDAEAEMEAASWWYERQRRGLGSDFLNAIDNATARILEHPRAGTPVPGIADDTIRRIALRRFPYHVVYMELTDRIQVLALAHDRRRPFYWRGRMRP